MDETDDFRPYVEALLRRWWLLLGGALLAGLIGAGLSLLLPPTYEGNSLVLVVDSGPIVQFDPRFEAVVEDRPLQAYPQLATSDSVLEAVLAEVAPAVTEPGTLRQLREVIAVSTSNDPSLLRLTVRHRDPAAAALIANQWAEVFIAQANRVSGSQGTERLRFFSRQRDTARDRLDAVEQALADFQATNRERLVAAELQALEGSLAALLAEQGKVERLQRDIAALRAQLGKREAALSPVEQLAVLLLYARAFSDEPPADSQQPALPLELQLGTDLSAAVTGVQLIGALDSLSGTLDSVAVGIGEQINQVGPQILTLQQQLQALTGEAERRRQDVELAAEAYTALERQVAVEAITAEDTGRGLRLASAASLPEAPVAPQAWLNGVLAAVVAFAALVAVVLWREWRNR